MKKTKIIDPKTKEEFELFIYADGIVLRGYNRKIVIKEKDNNISLTMAKIDKNAHYSAVFHANPRKNLRLSKINLSPSGMRAIVEGWKVYLEYKFAKEFQSNFTAPFFPEQREKDAENNQE
jgi:hypothetical protein